MIRSTPATRSTRVAGRRAVVSVVVAVLLAACSSSAADAPLPTTSTSTTSSTTSSPTTSTSTTSTTSTTTTTTPPPTTRPNLGGVNLGDGPGGSSIPPTLPVPAPARASATSWTVEGSGPAAVPPPLPAAVTVTAAAGSTRGVATTATARTATSTTTETTTTMAPIPTGAELTARRLYRALVTGDDATVRALGAVGPVRTNLGGDAEDLIARWSADPAEDLFDVMIRLLETSPAVDSDGNVVWPGLAARPPEGWTDADAADLARLGFPPNVVAAIMAKGRYLDRRLVIGPDGVWRAFVIGTSR
jgi:hypothetical protein